MIECATQGTGPRLYKPITAIAAEELPAIQLARDKALGYESPAKREATEPPWAKAPPAPPRAPLQVWINASYLLNPAPLAAPGAAVTGCYTVTWPTPATDHIIVGQRALISVRALLEDGAASLPPAPPFLLTSIPIGPLVPRETALRSVR